MERTNEGELDKVNGPISPAPIKSKVSVTNALEYGVFPSKICSPAAYRTIVMRMGGGADDADSKRKE